MLHSLVEDSGLHFKIFNEV